MLPPNSQHTRAAPAYAHFPHLESVEDDDCLKNPTPTCWPPCVSPSARSSSSPESAWGNRWHAHVKPGLTAQLFLYLSPIPVTVLSSCGITQVQSMGDVSHRASAPGCSSKISSQAQPIHVSSAVQSTTLKALPQVSPVHLLSSPIWKCGLN